MTRIDLGQVADDLRKKGIEAQHDFLYFPHGCVEGLDVDDDFFPLWELILEENAGALELGDFAAIKSRREPNWTPEPPLRLRLAVT